MNQPSAPTRVLKALAAAGALLAVVHGAHAAPPAPPSTQVDVVGQLPLREACPAVDVADLADALTAAWDDAARPSAVAVTFKVQRSHVYDVAPATDSARTYHQIRHALAGLRCDGGDDRAHSVRFIVRFEDGAGATRVARIAELPER